MQCQSLRINVRDIGHVCEFVKFATNKSRFPRRRWVNLQTLSYSNNWTDPHQRHKRYRQIYPYLIIFHDTRGRHSFFSRGQTETFYCFIKTYFVSNEGFFLIAVFTMCRRPQNEFLSNDYVRQLEKVHLFPEQLPQFLNGVQPLQPGIDPPPPPWTFPPCILFGSIELA